MYRDLLFLNTFVIIFFKIIYISVKEEPNLPGTIYTVADEIESKGVKAFPIQVDVRDEKRCTALVDETVKNLGSVDILINNASALWWASIEETPINKYDLITSINARGTFAVTQAALKQMREQGTGGHVIMQSPPIVLDKLAGMTGLIVIY